MRKIGSTGRSLFILGFTAALLSTGTAVAQNLIVYDDALQNGFADWGWAPDRSFSDPAQHHTGTSSISFSSDATWQGITMNGNVDTSSYDAILMWVRGSQAGLTYDISLSGAGSSVKLSNFIAGSVIPNGSWALATIPFSSLGVSPGTGATGIVVQAEGTQAKIYLDDISLRAVPVAPITVTVDPNANRQPINPLIYGVAHFNEAGSSQLPYPARRWGGNAVTRYNWEIDVQNHASDWFFINEPNFVANPSQLPNNSTADLWVDSVKAHGGEPVLTVPTIGWAPKGSNPNTDRLQLYGSSIAKYGPQETNEFAANGGNPDAGNGCTPASWPGHCTFITPLVPWDPTDTSKPTTPAYFTAWLNHIAGRVGTAANGGVKYLILDNEPMLWDSTHHDVHPNPVTYDELWQKDRDSAIAWKANDPYVQILGGAAWGWCEYFSSSKDSALYGGCGPGGPNNDPGHVSDYTTHGNMLWLPYLLQQARAYENANGTRILDFLDIHFYPQANNVALTTTDESSATSALRLRTLKSLYDPTYSDESWIGQPVNLIPRMKAWIAQYAPGTKFAINEYNFGDVAMGASSALAQAEALAIFGREGVDMANRWVVPPANSLIEDAFLMYLNYDGAGGKVAGDSVSTVSTDVNRVGAYTVRDASHLYFLLFNKDTSDRQVTVAVAGGCSGAATLYRFSGAMRLGNAGTVATAGGCMTVNLPTRSATLAVLPYTGTPTPQRFYTLPPCRLVDTRGADGPLSGPSLAATTKRTFALAGRCNVPRDARALSLNVTAVNPSTAGDLRLYAADLPGVVPIFSSVSLKAGAVRANNAMVAVSDDGTGSIAVQPNLAGGTAHFVLDVNGFFR